MTIPNYICELLYRYDCVILPNFGALLTNRVSAQLSSDNKVFYPPQKRLSFNQQIVNNDGLLANYISVNENITYKNAVAKVENFVSQIQHELKEKGRLSLNEIGLFNLNHEQKLVFEPVHTNNYLTEAFGLATFQANVVERKVLKVEREVLKKEVEELEEKVPVIAFTPEKRKSFKPFTIAASVAAILFLGGALVMNSYKKRAENHNMVETLKGMQMAEDEIQNASFALDILSPLPSISVSVNKKEAIAKNGDYHVVAGAFREFANVEKKMFQLKRKGFDPVYIGANKYGLHQVVYQSFTTRNEAVNALNTIKRTENSSAWLLITK